MDTLPSISSSKTSHNNSASKTAHVALYISFFITTMLIAGIIVFAILLNRESAKVAQHERNIELLTNATGPRFIYIDENDVRLMAIEAAQKEFDSYLDNISHHLTIFSILITIMVTLVGFIFPLLINSEQGKANKEKIDEAVIKGEAGLNKRINEIKGEIKKMVVNNKQGIKVSNDRIERLTLEQRSIIDGMLNDLNTRLDNYAESIQIEKLAQEADRIGWYQTIEREGRATSDTYFNLAKYHVNNNPDLANRYFAKAIENRGNYAVVYPCWADYLEAQGQLFEAWEKREKAILFKTNRQELEELEKQQRVLLTRMFDSENKLDEKLPIQVGEVKFDMILVHKGIFMMGATAEQGNEDTWANESPAHKVLLTDYYISKTVVTQSLWEEVMGSTDESSRASSDKDDCPKCNISWYECMDFIKILNKKTSYNFLLPTEAQWEYAARGGDKSHNYKYSGSNDLGEVAWYWKNSGDSILHGLYDTNRIENNNCRTHIVNEENKKKNELGLCGMSGNVWEWCRDKYKNYSVNPKANPACDKGVECVIRGGGYLSYERNCRVSSRYYCSPEDRDQDLGFRLVIEVEK